MTNNVGQVEWELNNIPGLLERTRTLLGIDPAGEGLADATPTAAGKVELATPAEVVAGTDGVRAATPEGVAAAIAASKSGVHGVTFTVGATDTGTIGIQLLDANGDDLAEAGCVQGYFSSVVAGYPPSGSPPGVFAIGTDGAMYNHDISVIFTLISELDGHIDLVITEAGAATWYLVIVLPNGTLAVSSAIEFTV